METTRSLSMSPYAVIALAIAGIIAAYTLGVPAVPARADAASSASTCTSSPTCDGVNCPNKEACRKSGCGCGCQGS